MLQAAVEQCRGLLSACGGILVPRLVKKITSVVFLDREPVHVGTRDRESGTGIADPCLAFQECSDQVFVRHSRFRWSDGLFRPSLELRFRHRM